MIYDAATLPLPLKLTADLCVIGSGPGGATAAMLAAEAGLKVVILEAGDFIPPSEMNQREDHMLPRLFWDAGTRMTTDRRIRVHQGRGVGGSSLHNLNLCKRIHPTMLARWASERKLERLSVEAWGALYTEAEALISVSDVPADAINRHNRLLADGCAALGWASGPLRHNRTGCIRSGFCELGCSFDAKNNALKVCIPRAIRAGAEVITRCEATRIRHQGGAVTGVAAVVVVDGAEVGAVEVSAPRVCLSASATGTAALLLRSDVPDPGGETGNHLRIHPAGVVAGEFAEPVRAWEGIPQTWECTQWLNLEKEDEPGAHRTWIVPAFAHPVGTATLVPGFGPAHGALMRRYSHLAVLTAMLHDRSKGRVRPRGDRGLHIDYTLDAADRDELRFGLLASARILFAAGAKRVFIPGAPAVELAHPDDATVPDEPTMTAVHPMGSVPMGDDPTVAAVGSDGRHHHLQNLWIADGSLFPTSIGGPPQLSIYAMGLHVGRRIIEAG